MKVCFITSTRADYGLLKQLMNITKQNHILQIIVTGGHLEESQGYTYKQIEKDGFTINSKVNMKLTGDKSHNIVSSMGIEMSMLSQSFQTLQPDVLVVLGDRYEILTGVLAATIFKIPIIHLCGGDITEGAYDNSIRHAITKLSHVHIPTNKTSRDLIIQMGEDPAKVYDFGNPGLEFLIDFQPLSKDTLEKSLNTKLNKHNVVIMYHPTTLANNEKNDTTNIINAMCQLNVNQPNTNFYIFGSNTDNNNNIINSLFKKMCNDNNNDNDNENMFFNTSIPRYNYLSLIYYSDVLLGNSSSGIYEASHLSTPTVNIGTRQQGRLAPNSVFNCNSTSDDILCHTEQAIAFDMTTVKQVYELKHTSKLFSNLLNNIKKENLLHKKFNIMF